MSTHSNILKILWLFKLTVKNRHLHALKKYGYTRITFILVEYFSGFRKKYWHYTHQRLQNESLSMFNIYLPGE